MTIWTTVNDNSATWVAEIDETPAWNSTSDAAFTSSADDVMELVYNGTSWFEVSRSVN